MSRASPEPDSGRTPDPGGGSGSDGVVAVLRSTGVAFAVSVLGFAAGFAILFLLANVFFATGVLSPEPSPVAVALLSVVSLQGLGFPLVAVAYLRLRGLSLAFLKIRWPSLRQVGVAVGGVVAILALVLVSQAVVSALGLTPAQRSDAELLTDPNFAVVGIPLMLLLVGPGEELLFRGIVQSTIRETASAPVAIVIANLAFAPAHVIAFLGSGSPVPAILLSLSLLFLPGVVFGVVFEYTDNLVVPALSHGLWNSLLLATVLLGA